MITFTKVISTQFDKAKRRLIKVLRFGSSDIQTPYEVTPFGVDSSPIKDMVAVYASGNSKDKNTIIGYIKKNQLAAQGETRLFSLDNFGNVKAEAWLKTDGSIELNGASDNVVKYIPLNAAVQQQTTLINTELGKIATAIGSLGGAYVATPISIDISSAKVEKVKTN